MRFCDRLFFRLALVGALVGALGLAGCGRKGPLDLPPAASATGEGGNAPAAGAPNKSLPIDVLLN